MTVATGQCWICGDTADSGEHKSKRSDLKAVFGKVSAKRPIHFHDGTKLNRKVKSLDADVLKWRNVICHYCNTTRTQPHDSGGRLRTIFMVSRLTLMTRWNSFSA